MIAEYTAGAILALITHLSCQLFSVGGLLYGSLSSHSSAIRLFRMLSLRPSGSVVDPTCNELVGRFFEGTDVLSSADDALCRSCILVVSDTSPCSVEKLLPL